MKKKSKAKVMYALYNNEDGQLIDMDLCRNIDELAQQYNEMFGHDDYVDVENLKVIECHITPLKVKRHGIIIE